MVNGADLRDGGTRKPLPLSHVLGSRRSERRRGDYGGRRRARRWRGVPSGEGNGWRLLVSFPGARLPTRWRWNERGRLAPSARAPCTVCCGSAIQIQGKSRGWLFS